MPGSEDDVASIWSQLGNLQALASADPDGFLAALAAAVLPNGGWAAFGAGRAIWTFLNPNERPSVLDHPAYSVIMDASIAFLRTMRGSQGHLTAYEWQRWVASGGTHETW